MRYGEVSQSHKERFEPGSLRAAPVVHLDLHHDPERAVAWLPDGGLELRDEQTALLLTADLPPIPAAERALAEVGPKSQSAPLRGCPMAGSNSETSKPLCCYGLAPGAPLATLREASIRLAGWMYGSRPHLAMESFRDPSGTEFSMTFNNSPATANGLRASGAGAMLSRFVVRRGGAISRDAESIAD